VEDVIDRLPQLGARAAYFKQTIHEKLIEHKEFIREHGDDLPAIAGWRWNSRASGGARSTSTEGDNV
jgi:xylulose-5-phosphate/fructose-6-phosphate phosphoketolase